MKPRKEPLVAPQDAELFRQAVEGVTPLPASDRLHHRPPPRYAPTQSQSASPDLPDLLSDPVEGTQPANSFHRDGVARATLLKLRRGHFPVEGSIDLHGYTSDEARRQLPAFLAMAREQGWRCIVVIHGKGWHTDGGEGVLKTRTRHWLTQCADVLAFCEAPPAYGGGGAVLVLLKSAGR